MIQADTTSCATPSASTIMKKSFDDDNTSCTSTEDDEQEEVDVPASFICPITQEIMADPVMSRYGQSYERAAILEWLQSGEHTTCPLTRQPLSLKGLITNHKLRVEILNWQRANGLDLVMTMKHPGDDGNDSDEGSSASENLGLVFCVTLPLGDNTQQEDEEATTPIATPAEVPATTADNNRPTSRRRRIGRFRLIGRGQQQRRRSMGGLAQQ